MAAVSAHEPVSAWRDGQFSFAVRTIGGIAARLLSHTGRGRVLAVFGKCFYVELEHGLLCVGAEGFTLGPLNLITSAPASTRWLESGVRVGDAAVLGGGVLRVGHRFRFRLDGAAEWRPAYSGISGHPSALREGLQRFRLACAGVAPAEGLGRLIFDDTAAGPRSPVIDRGRVAIRLLDDWLDQVLRDPDMPTAQEPEGLNLLMGLGPGLTPAGDDVLGGMMIAAHALGEEAVARRLWRCARPLAEKAAGPIARAHLAAAADGMGADGVHRAIDAILRGRAEDFGSVIAGIDAIGHSSGWDAMAGVTRFLEASFHAREAWDARMMGSAELRHHLAGEFLQPLDRARQIAAVTADQEML